MELRLLLCAHGTIYPSLSTRNLGNNGRTGFIAEAKWPDINESGRDKEETITLPIQINGKEKLKYQ